MYSGKDYCSRTKKRRGKRVREEAIYSGGRLAGGWSAGRQVVCLRHNRTGRTCDIVIAFSLETDRLIERINQVVEAFLREFVNHAQDDWLP